MHIKPFVALLVTSFLLITSSVHSSEQTLQQLLPEIEIKTKIPGNPAVSYPVMVTEELKTQTKCEDIDLKVVREMTGNDRSMYTLTLKAINEVNFHISMNFVLKGMPHEPADFLLPGLWYKRNMKVSAGAPSMSVSNSWMFREDRLSSPMVASYNPDNKKYFSLKHSDIIRQESLLPYNSGEVIMYGESDLGSVGFGEVMKQTYLGCTIRWLNIRSRTPANCCSTNRLRCSIS